MRRMVKVTGGKKTMNAELAALRVGVMTADDFVRRTFGDWSKLGEYLAGRWELPPGLDGEDARQEMLLALFESESVASWDPERSVPLARYVVWNACSETKQYLHKQRGALRWSGKAQSRFPLPFSALGREHDPEVVQQADQDGRAEARQLLHAVGELLSEREREVWVLLVEVGGSRTEAIDRLVEAGACTAEEARAVVASTISAARAAMATLDAA